MKWTGNQAIARQVPNQAARISGNERAVVRSALITAIEYLTGAAGPLRTLLDWFRAHGLGERVIKSAVAAVVAWLLAGLLPDNPAPILAPLTAIFSINLTIAGSMRDAVQRVLGVVFGILLAVLSASTSARTPGRSSSSS